MARAVGLLIEDEGPSSEVLRVVRSRSTERPKAAMSGERKTDTHTWRSSSSTGQGRLERRIAGRGGEDHAVAERADPTLTVESKASGTAPQHAASTPRGRSGAAREEFERRRGDDHIGHSRALERSPGLTGSEDRPRYQHGLVMEASEGHRRGGWRATTGSETTSTSDRPSSLPVRRRGVGGQPVASRLRGSEARGSEGVVRVSEGDPDERGVSGGFFHPMVSGKSFPTVSVGF